MKTLLISFIAISWAVHAGLVSPFPSTVDNLSISNSHSMDEQQRVIRGMEPRKLIAELLKFGITDVLIFKSQTRTEVDDERAELMNLGMAAEQISHIPFKWRHFESQQVACRQLLQGLSLIKEVLADPDRKIFFHCTVGEDRTGALAGLYRVAFDDKKVEQAFEAEMCKWGYARANPKKPYNVVRALRKELTPLFLKMAYKFERGEWSQDNFDPGACRFSASFEADFVKWLKRQKSKFRCPKADLN